MELLWRLPLRIALLMPVWISKRTDCVYYKKERLITFGFVLVIAYQRKIVNIVTAFIGQYLFHNEDEHHGPFEI